MSFSNEPVSFTLKNWINPENPCLIHLHDMWTWPNYHCRSYAHQFYDWLHESRDHDVTPNFKPDVCNNAKLLMMMITMIIWVVHFRTSYNTCKVTNRSQNSEFSVYMFVFTLIRITIRITKMVCIYTSWGCIVITSYLGVFKGTGTLMASSYYKE